MGFYIAIAMLVILYGSVVYGLPIAMAGFRDGLKIGTGLLVAVLFVLGWVYLAVDLMGFD